MAKPEEEVRMDELWVNGTSLPAKSTCSFNEEKKTMICNVIANERLVDKWAATKGAKRDAKELLEATDGEIGYEFKTDVEVLGRSA